MDDRPEWFRRMVLSPVSGPDNEQVRVAQLLLRVPVTGVMDTATVASLRGIQRLFNLPVTGGLDLETAKALDSLRWVDAVQE